MLINKVIKYCDEQYQNTICTACTSKTKCADNCDNNCKSCLDDIHFHKNIIRTQYDCEKLLHYYVCRYSYKYCSEILYALRTLDLSNYPFFHILSLGCGGAPDLMAFQLMKYTQPISYIGLDKNLYWENIHNYIINIFNEETKEKAQFIRDIDVLEYFNNSTIKGCNVIIIQYLISFFYSYKNQVIVQKWFKELAEGIVKYKPKESPLLIIINDTDSINTGRDTFHLFVNEIENVGLSIKINKRLRFKSTSYYENSTLHESNRNLFDSIPDDFINRYCTALACSSAQLILEVN